MKRQCNEGRTTFPWFGSLVVGVFIFLVIFGYWIAPFDYDNWDMSAGSRPPVWEENGSISHILGTDPLGRDVLSRLIHGSRYSLAIAVACLAVCGSIGIVIGMTSGFFGGRVDMAIMRATDLWMSFPPIILAILLAGIAGAGAVTVVAVIGLAGWPSYARIVRGECLHIKQNDYIKMAKVIGCSNLRIMCSHIFPNLTETLIVLFTLDIGQIIILTATLSFLGLGTQPPSPDWGLMLNEGRQYINHAWWLVVFPSVAILLTVLGFNLVGDWVSDTLDPKNRLS
jgi:peptide/nickel transport system permease protein